MFSFITSANSAKLVLSSLPIVVGAEFTGPLSGGNVVFDRFSHHAHYVDKRQTVSVQQVINMQGTQYKDMFHVRPSYKGHCLKYMYQNCRLVSYIVKLRRGQLHYYI